MDEPTALYLVANQLVDPRFTSLAVIASEQLDPDFRQTARELNELLLALQRATATGTDSAPSISPPASTASRMPGT